MDPIQWFEMVYCSKCKTKSCLPKGQQMVYTEDITKKLWCVEAIKIMLITDEDTARKLRKKKN
jgi:hypothetical protein